MHKEFALSLRGPKRLKINYARTLSNVEVLFDGQKVMTFATKTDFQRGMTAKLPDGSILTVSYGPVVGAPILKGVHVIHNGVPVRGSAADPVPAWAWVFMVSCVLIPVVSLGGALPGLIAGLGVTGTLAVSRRAGWSTALRVGASALITVAAWAGFLALASSLGLVKAGNGAKDVASSKDASETDADKLIRKIGATYWNHGYKQSDIDNIKDRLYDECDTMKQEQCLDHLSKALKEAENAADQTAVQ
jgi:hypothetical protein